jgi:hypothetical protein
MHDKQFVAVVVHVRHGELHGKQELPLKYVPLKQLKQLIGLF